MHRKKHHLLLFLLPFLFLSTGCTKMWSNVYESGTDHKVTSSLADYLYPEMYSGDQNTQSSHQKVSRLKSLEPTPSFWASDTIVVSQGSTAKNNRYRSQTKLNSSGQKHLLRVGIAFVPTKGELPGLSQARKVQLLRQVENELRQYPFVKHIEIIPQIHFRGGRGFQQLEKVGEMFNVDSMALVSYDQVIHTDDNHLSVLYLTVIGAFIIPGSQYDSQTFVDTTLVDIKSRDMLLRASGIDNTESATTLVGSTQQKRSSRFGSFENAFNDMLVSLSQHGPAPRKRPPTTEQDLFNDI